MGWLELIRETVADLMQTKKSPQGTCALGAFGKVVKGSKKVADQLESPNVGTQGLKI